MRHLDKILSIIMEEQSLYAKASKCKFGLTEILYLGHVISAQGVQVHQEKIQAILDWPTPRSLIEQATRILWAMHVLQALREGIFTARCTFDRSYKERGFQLDRGLTHREHFTGSKR